MFTYEVYGIFGVRKLKQCNCNTIAYAYCNKFNANLSYQTAREHTNDFKNNDNDISGKNNTLSYFRLLF